jgi:hypothetical protein
MKPRIRGIPRDFGTGPVWLWEVQFVYGWAGHAQRTFFTYPAALDFANERSDIDRHKPHMTRWPV